MTYTATYSPEDNKLRLYASSRLDAETYERVRAAGFRWAPKQELFVAPGWSPAREDLLTELAGEIDDEDTSLVERAEAKAERLEDLSAKRAREAVTARDAVDKIADGIPFGQPILVGHHSEKRARKDAEKITNGMRKAVSCFEAATYWASRAKGAIRLAKYKERPDVRARRIKGLEADLRRIEKTERECQGFLKAWNSIQEGDNQAHAKALHICNYSHISKSFPLADFPRQPPASQYEGPMGLWSALEGNVITWQQAQTIAVRVYTTGSPHRARWIAHYQNRLAYERTMLEEAGASDLLKPKARPTLAPILNYRAAGGTITAPNRWRRNDTITLRQVDMTKAEFAAVYEGRRGVMAGMGNGHRFRFMINRTASGAEYLAVFLTDSKEHPRPAEVAPQPPPERPAPTPRPAAAPYQPSAAEVAAQEMRAALKAGVTVAVVPQLFPTPRDLADKIVAMASLEDGDHVLEPSAGTGALMAAAHDAVPGIALTAVEVNAKLADALEASWGDAAHVFRADFLETHPPDVGGQVDAVLMNPPFENGADIKHIRHALGFVKPGGRLVAICANGPRQREAFMDSAEHWEDLPAGTFANAGTQVNTALMVLRAPS